MGIEFFCPDCPRAKAQEVCEMINFLVGRMKKGYPVGDGQTASSEGRDICLKLTLLNDAERAAAGEVEDTVTEANQPQQRGCLVDIKQIRLHFALATPPELRS